MASSELQNASRAWMTVCGILGGFSFTALISLIKDQSVISIIPARYRSNEVTKIIANEIGLNKEMILLEIGSGRGERSIIFGLCVSYFVALEINYAYCRMIKEKFKKGKLKNIFVINADGQNLPFRSEVFDGSFCRAVLHHVPNPRQLVFEIYRVIKNNSVFLAIDEPNSLNPLWHIAKFLTRYLHIKKKFLFPNEFIQDENEQELGKKLYMPFCLWHLKEIFRQANFKFINGISLWLPHYAICNNDIYFKIWLMSQKLIKKTFIPIIFGQLFISGRK